MQNIRCQETGIVDKRDATKYSFFDAGVSVSECDELMWNLTLWILFSQMCVGVWAQDRQPRAKR